jgi:hypothetical protein
MFAPPQWELTSHFPDIIAQVHNSSLLMLSPPPKTTPLTSPHCEQEENVTTPTAHHVPLPADTEDEMPPKKPPHPNKDVDD